MLFTHIFHPWSSVISKREKETKKEKPMVENLSVFVHIVNILLYDYISL